MQFYPSMTGLDLRAGFEEFLHGSPTEAPKGRPIIHRKMTNTPCVCWDAKQASADPNCQYCLGEGFMWAELAQVAYFAKSFGNVLGAAPNILRNADLQQVGLLDDSKCLAYVSHELFPDYETYLNRSRLVYDKIYEVKLNPDGTLFYPLTRVAKWRVNVLTPHQGDFGKIEFIELALEKING